MAFRRRASKSRKKPVFKRARSKKSFAGKSRKRAAPQTVRIVIEQPSPQPMGIPGQLPASMGAIAAVTPRRNRF